MDGQGLYSSYNIAFFRIAAFQGVDYEENIEDQNCSRRSQAQLHDAQLIRFYVMAEE